MHALRRGIAAWPYAEGVAPADAALLGHQVRVQLGSYLPDAGSAGASRAAAALGAAAASVG